MSQTNQRNMPYDLHVPLMPHFQGFQGTDPEHARYLFLGKDANFREEFHDGEHEHPIWPYLTAYLAGEADWLHAGPVPQILHGVPMNRVHHPALLQLWPGQLPYHRRTFRRLFERIEHLGGEDGLHRHCSFVELLCWPTVGNTGEIGDRFPQLVQGIIPEEVPDGNLEHFRHHGGEFPCAQWHHRENLQQWFGKGQRLIVAPKSVFEIVCEDHAEPGLPPAIADLQDEVDEYWAHHPFPFANWWLYDTGARGGQPRVVVTRGFPHFQGGPHQAWWNANWQMAVGAIAQIIVEDWQNEGE
jgi:hypothetical protein